MSGSHDVWHLKRLDWLETLGDAEWGLLRARATRKEYAEGEAIFAPTRDPRSVYLLERGSARIYRLSSGGDEVTLGYVAAGEVFGELAGFGDYPRESFAVAAAPSAIWRIPVDLFRRLLRERPELVIAVTRQIGERMKRVESRVESLVFRSVRDRVAMLLLELAQEFAHEDGDALVFDAPFTQQELATLVGASRQSVNAALAAFRAEGCIRIEEKRLRIEDVAGLRASSR